MFTSDGNIEHEMNKQPAVPLTVMHVLYRKILIKRKLSWKAKLLIYQSIYVPNSYPGALSSD